MKEKMFIFSLIGLFLLTSGLLAQPRGKTRKSGPRMMQVLDLTAEQETKMQEIRLKFRKETLPLRTKLQSLRGDLKLEMTAEKFDEGKVEKIVEQMQEVRTEMQMKRILHKQAVREILTPEQRVKFDLHILSENGPGKGRRPGGAPHPRLGPLQPPIGQERE